MKNVRIYQPGLYSIGDTVELSATASQHVGTVLRMQSGEPLTLFCGDNREFPAVIATVQKKKVFVFINAAHEVNRESPRSIHLAQSISKGERMEMVIQKAVELGVSSVTPLLTTYCVVRLDNERFEKKRQQWQGIAIAACEQSGRNTLPIIHPLCTFDTYLQQCQATMKMILDPYTTNTWQDLSRQEGDIALLVGPEGGFSEEEIAQAKASKFQPLSLGPRILRTETAAIAALSVIQAVLV